MSRYATQVKADIERWRAAGLVDAPTAQRLAADVSARAKGGFSFGSILAVMAAILVGFAILTFVAANWETIPRIARVLALFSTILVSYVGGAALRARGSPFGEALYLIGALTFGGSIALIGQMYHFDGDETQAVLVWCMGTIVAAAGLRSPLLTNAAVVIGGAWLVMRGLDWGPNRTFPYGFLPLAAVLWGISYWTGSRVARHLLLLSIILFAVMLGVHTSFLVVGLGLVVVSSLVFLAAHFAGDTVERYAQLGGPYPAHSLIGFMTGISMIQAQFFNDFWPMLAITLVAFAGIVAALLMRGRQSATMRWLAYAAFTVELALLYFGTLGTLIDTAALLLFSGVALAVVAVVILRIERRFGAERAGESTP